MATATELLGAHVDAWIYQLSSTFQNMWAKLVATGSMFFGLHIVGFYGDHLLIGMILKLMILDLVVGIWDAKKNKTWSTYKFLVRGAVKFPLYAIYLYLVGSLDTAAERVLGVDLPIIELFCLYLISGEVYSICRHLKYIGFQVPELLLWLSFGFKRKAERKVKEMLDHKDDKEHDQAADEEETPKNPDAHSGE